MKTLSPLVDRIRALDIQNKDDTFVTPNRYSYAPSLRYVFAPLASHKISQP